MTVRELLIRMGFSFDQAKAKQADVTIEGLKSKASSMVGVLTGIGAALGVAFGLDKIKDIADEWSNIDSRIGLVTNSAAEHKQALEEVYNIANLTRQEYTTTGDLFTKLSRGSKEFGASQADVLSVTETINKALVVGGASTAEAKSTILQLGQALSSGRLQGDELRSLGENAPMLMQEVAKAYGVSIGKLKELGAEGKLDSKGVFEAILKAKAVMDAQFEKMPMTIGQAVTVAGNKFGRFINNIGKETGIFKTIARWIVSAMDAAERGITKVAKRVGGFNNLFKIATAVLAAFGAGMVALKWGSIVSGIQSVASALWAFAANPAAWVAIAIAAAVLLLALAIEDLYTWINGGESVIGDWLGSWDEFKVKASEYLAPVLEGLQRLWAAIQQDLIPVVTSLGSEAMGTFSAIYNFLKPIIVAIINEFMQLTNNGKLYFDLLLTWWNGVVNGIILTLKFWRQIFEGDFKGAIDTAIQFFKNFFTTVVSILKQIGAAIARHVLSKLGWAGRKLAELGGINLGGIAPPGSIAGAGAGGPNNVNQEFTFNTQFAAGTSAEHASYVQNNLKDTFSETANGLVYATGGEG